MNYVCGFYMNFAMDQFLLIKKAGPDWMAGKWNGIGGKINQYVENVITKEKFYPKVSQLIPVVNPSRVKDFVHCTESAYQAMCREFKEETGIDTKEYEWHCFFIKQFAKDTKVYYFAAFGDKFKHAKSMTEEEVKVFDTLDLLWNPPKDFIYDVPYLIQMIRAEMRNSNFITLNPEGINDDKYSKRASKVI